MQENETIDRVEKMFEPSSSPVTEEGVLHMQREREKKREAEKVVDRKGDGGEDVKTESTESLVYVKSREKGKENKNKTAWVGGFYYICVRRWERIEMLFRWMLKLWFLIPINSVTVLTARGSREGWGCIETAAAWDASWLIRVFEWRV